MRLSDLKPGQSATITKVMGYGGFRRRILEMGFVRGKRVEAVQSAPLNDPVKYKIMDYEVSLRRSEAGLIEVITNEEAQAQLYECRGRRGEECEESVESIIDRSSRHIRVALVGNPNSGKTSLFNAISGGHEHVGNYSGVTVDVKRGVVRHRGYEIEIYDLPGTYALSAYTPEELYVRQHIVSEMPDVVMNVVAASNLERNLYLTTELIDMHLSVVVALNMYDELEASGAQLDYKLLGELLGIEFVPTVARSRQGITELLDAVIANFEGEHGRHIHISYGHEIDEAIGELLPIIKQEESLAGRYHGRYVALKLLEQDSELDRELRASPHYGELVKVRNARAEHIKTILGEDIETAISNEKYGFIAGALAETYKAVDDAEQGRTTRAIDSILTHRVWGFPIFFLFMWIMFEATFSLGAYPMGWLESLMGWLGDVVSANMADGMLKDMLVDGIIGGVGGVIVFLPNILILYFFIALMEDSGYLARAAFIMDRVMHRIGLHGKSFIPLLMGFGCGVPAIMATRTIESRSSRLITILTVPFMSCGARLPVYLLIAGAFFGRQAGMVLFCLYVLGIIVAALTAYLLRKVMFKKDDTPFVMELPPYRLPTGRATVHHMWEKAAQYLRKMGGIVLLASLVIWFLSYFPRHDDPAVQMKESYIGQAGQFIEPVVEPLGMNWKGGVALITGAAAKEVVVSTLGVLYASDDETLGEALKKPDPATGKPDFTMASALAFLVFILLYFPCVAALAAVRGETGRWRWVAFTVFYNTALAWILAFATYHITNLFL